MTPLEQKFRGGGGGLIGRTIRGGGMDIFWNHTIDLKYTKKHCVYGRSYNAILNCKVCVQPNETVFVA